MLEIRGLLVVLWVRSYLSAQSHLVFYNCHESIVMNPAVCLVGYLTSASRRMNAKILACFVATIVLMTCGCDAIHEQLTPPFMLIAVDDELTLGIARHYDNGISIGRIGAVVTDAGWDAKYIVAAQRPPGKPGIPPSYYYVDIAKDSDNGNQYQAVTGPLSKSEFEEAKLKLGLPEFSRHFEHLR
jgi:hypothetical protein